VLLLVPDLFFLTRIETAARRAGLRVIRAADAPSALAAARRERPAGAVVDLGAPESAGPMRFLTGMLGDPALAGIPTLGFLSHVRADLAQAARAAGCGTVVAKSALSEDTAGLLTRLVEGATALDSAGEEE